MKTEDKEQQINKLVEEYRKSLYGQYLEDQLPFILKGYAEALRTVNLLNESVDGFRDECIKVIEGLVAPNCNDHTPYRGACNTCGQIENWNVLPDPEEVIKAVKNIPHIQKQNDTVLTSKLEATRKALREISDLYKGDYEMPASKALKKAQGIALSALTETTI